MPEQENSANQTTPITTTTQTKAPINWKLIGIISVVTAVIIGGLGYGSVVLGLFGKSAPIQTNTTTKTTKTTTNTATPSASTNTTKETPKDETADWKTYNNGNTDFTFKCPKNWVNDGIAPSDGVDTNGGFFISYYCMDTAKGSTYLYVNHYSLLVNASESLSTYSKVSSLNIGESKTFTDNKLQYIYTRKPDITVAGQTAFRYSMTFKNYNYNNSNTLVTFEYEGSILKRVVSSNKVFYDLNVMGGKSTTERNDLLNQLISTFKFL